MSTDVARDSFDAFHSGDYGRCGQLLEQVGGNKSANDIKATHNSFINEYYKTGCTDPRLLLTQLTQAHDRLRERDKKEKVRRRKEDDEEEAYRADEDLSVLRYNQALLCMQLRLYTQATIILEELFENIEPIDDFLAIKICFLLLELYLLTREPEQAVHVLAYLEKPNAFLTLLRSNRPAKVDPAKTGEEMLDGESKVDGEDPPLDELGDAAAAEAAALSAPAVIMRSETAANADEAPEGPLPSLTLGAFLPRHGRAPDTISRQEYKFYCLMYRARLAATLKNTKAAKKDVKSALELYEQDLRRAPLLTCHQHTTGTVKSDKPDKVELVLRDCIQNQQNAMIIVLKAYLEYNRQNVRKAMKLMASCQFNFAQSKSLGDGTDKKSSSKSKSKSGAGDEDGEEQAPTDFHPAQDEACASVFYNNLGCIHFMMQKPNLASFYFQKALKARPLSTSQDTALLGAKVGLNRPGVAASKHWLDRRAEMSYNAGLQMLMCDRPVCAYKCFEQCVSVFRTWPRLWLRIAECCIEMHRQGLKPSVGSGAAEAYVATEETEEGGGSSSKCRYHGSSSKQESRADHLCWSIQGVGPRRRWLLTTTKIPQVGRPGGSIDGETDFAAKAPSPVGQEAEDGPGPRDADGLPVHLHGDGALRHAAMCLRNVLVVSAPVSTDGTGDSADGAAGSSSSAAAVSGAGDSSASTAAVGGADKASASVKKPANSADKKARELLACDASLLEDAALVKMAYVALCLNDPAASLRNSRRLLEKNFLVPVGAAGSSGGEAASSVIGSGKTGHLQDSETEEARKQWAFQTGSFLNSSAVVSHAADGKTPSATAGPVPKFPASSGCVMLAMLYAAEALLHIGKVAEAKVLLGTFLKEGSSGGAAPKSSELQSNGFQDIERILAAHVVGGLGAVKKPTEADRPEDAEEERTRAVCGGLNPATPMGGLTPPSWVLHGAGGPGALQAAKAKGADTEKDKSSAKESGHAAFVAYPPTEFPRLGDSQCMMLTNLAALHIQDGNLKEAERCCERALQAQPRAFAPLRTLVYVLMRKGNNQQALSRLKQSRLQGSR